MDKRKYLPYNILDLTGYGLFLEVSEAQLVELIQDIITNGTAIYRLTNENDTDISNRLIKTNIPLNVLSNIPNKIQRIKAIMRSRVGYLNVGIVDENKVYSFSQFWYQSGIVLNATVRIEEDHVSLDIDLIANNA